MVVPRAKVVLQKKQARRLRLSFGLSVGERSGVCNHAGTLKARLARYRERAPPRRVGVWLQGRLAIQASRLAVGVLPLSTTRDGYPSPLLGTVNKAFFRSLYAACLQSW